MNLDKWRTLRELGVGTRATGWTAAEATGLSNIVAIAAGSGQGTHGVSAAVRQDGTLWVWGSGSSAMMGNGVRNPTPDEPVRLGGYSSYAIRSDGTLWIWGFALGPGRGILSRNLATPTRLDLP